MLSIIHAPMVSGELEKNIATFVECTCTTRFSGVLICEDLLISCTNFPSLLVSYQVEGMCDVNKILFIFQIHDMIFKEISKKKIKLQCELETNRDLRVECV